VNSLFLSITRKCTIELSNVYLKLAGERDKDRGLMQRKWENGRRDDDDDKLSNKLSSVQKPQREKRNPEKRGVSDVLQTGNHELSGLVLISCKSGTHVNLHVVSFPWNDDIRSLRRHGWYRRRGS